MFHFFSDIWDMISSFALIDYILYFAVVLLIMLIVSLVYVMREEKEEKKEELKPSLDLEKDLPLVKNKEEEIDLKTIVNTIDENPKPLIDMTAYEEEQEQKAIISYDELLKEAKQNQINYDQEELVDDLIPVKKITINPNAFEEPVVPISKSLEKKPLLLFSYEKEEAFLKAVQQLNELLN